MNGVQTRFKCKLDVKRCKRFVFPPSSLLPRSNALKTKAIRYFQTDRTLTRIVSPPLLEHIAHLLVSTDFTLNQISEQTNYQTKFSLAKAFKKHFGVSTSQYREKYKPMYDEQHAVITPEIRSILPMKVFCIEVGEKYKDELRYKLIWDRLTNYARQRNEEKSNDKFVSLSMDDPAITPIDKCRFYLGVIIDNKENDSQPGVMEVPGGRYAIFRHIGDYSLLHKFYRTIYEEWFPESKYRPQSTFSFEMYMNRPASTLKTELITDIYIPVIKK